MNKFTLDSPFFYPIDSKKATISAFLNHVVSRCKEFVQDIESIEREHKLSTWTAYFASGNGLHFKVHKNRMGFYNLIIEDSDRLIVAEHGITSVNLGHTTKQFKSSLEKYKSTLNSRLFIDRKTLRNDLSVHFTENSVSLFNTLPGFWDNVLKRSKVTELNDLEINNKFHVSVKVAKVTKELFEVVVGVKFTPGWLTRTWGGKVFPDEDKETVHTSTIFLSSKESRSQRNERILHTVCNLIIR